MRSYLISVDLDVVLIMAINTYEGNILIKSTILNGSMKNLSFFGHMMNRKIMSTVNKPNTTYSIILVFASVRLLVDNCNELTICTLTRNSKHITQKA